jgi:hypothetical protein
MSQGKCSSSTGFLGMQQEFLDRILDDHGNWIACDENFESIVVAVAKTGSAL